MELQGNPDLKSALDDIRSKLKQRRGYAPRIAKKLRIKEHDVYNVASGRSKDPNVLRELINEVKKCESNNDPYEQLLTDYIKNVA